MQLTEQEILEKEEDDVNFLTSMANVDAQTARRVLKKHNGDMAKAADALLAGDRAGDWEKKLRTTPEPMYSDGMNTSTPITINLPLPSASVIDLTADTEDDEMTRAIQMSMEESSQSQPQFGPSERAPHPEWQMVRSNDPVIPGSTTTEDHTLNEAIQASLQDFREDADITPLQLTIREGNRPIALRTDTRELAYAALVIQAIYFIPQARATVSNLRLNKIDHLGTPPGHPDRAMWNLIELFTNMDLAQIAVIVDNELLPSLYVEGLDSKKTLPDASTSVVKAVATVIEQHIAAQTPEGEELEHLFSFSHANVTLVNGIQTKAQRSSEDGMVVVVEFGHTPHNDLISCISDNLTRIGNRSSSHDVIIRPSDIISFQLKRASNSTSKSSPDPFVYQKTIYLDRFLFDNIQLTNSKRKQEREMLDEIHRLKVMKETLTRSDNRDSLKTLRATIHYFENVANPDGDSTRRASLERVAQHLKNIMTVIESKVEDIDHQIEKLQAAVAVVYDCPELQRYRYDLRSVLVHSGLPGRKQMYSYVQDNEGVWWKTVDLEVTEVPEETVLTDPTGLHLGAGPYLLFYSRHLSDEQKHEPIVWPTLFSEAVEENNKKFLAEMHPELEIFSNSKPSFEAPLARALPIPQELQNRTHSRENSRAMSVDKEPL